MSDKRPKRSILPPIVFLGSSDLAAIRLRHIASCLDMSLAVSPGSNVAPPRGVLAGYTEWGARRRGAELYVCWNWASLRSCLVVLNPAALRANIQLMEGATAVPVLLNRAHIFEWIESFPWRDKVEEVALQEE